MRTANFRLQWCMGIALAAMASGAVASGTMRLIPIVNPPVNLDIKSQPMGEALNELGQKCGIQILFYSDVVRGIEGPALEGEFSEGEALSRLLSNTGLTYSRLNPRTVRIHHTDMSAAGPNETRQQPTQRMMQLASLQFASLPIADTSKNDGNEASSQGAPRSGTAEKRARNIEEVIVTAQKREERLIDTPISVGVLSGEELDRSSSRAVTDALNQVGGVTVTEIQPGRTDIVVRGVVSGSAVGEEGGASTAAYYLDEVPFGFTYLSQIVDTNAFDLSRVEILRGPQGTLYGANSLSGNVRILSNDANLNAFEVKGRTTFSSTEGPGGTNYGGDAAVNIPLIPGQLAVRAVAGYSQLSGFINSTFDGEQGINDTRAQNYRVKVQWRPTENLGIKVGATRSEVHNGAPSMSLSDLTTPFSSDQPDDRLLGVYSLVAEYNWKTVSLLSSTGYIDYTADTTREILLGATSRLDFQNQDRIKSSLSQEFRLLSHLEGPWRWSAGAFYRNTKEQRQQEVLGDAFKSFFPGTYIAGVNSESHAVFGEIARSFADSRYELTAGVRYFEDRQTVKDLGSFFNLPLQPDSVATFDHTTGRLLLSYMPHDHSMLYGSVATGFRTGSQQYADVRAVAPDFPAVDPDSLISYEFGAKGDLLDGKLTYEGAIYYMDWTDIQQSLILPIGFLARINAGTANGLGLDTTLSYNPTNSLTLDLSIGWNDLKFSENVYNFDSATQQNLLLFAKGARLNNSPELTGSVGARYRVATAWPGVDFVMFGNFAYGSERILSFLAASVVRETQSDDMRLLKASVGLASDRWSLDLYGENLLNEDAAITPPDIVAGATSVRSRPRTMGLQLTFNY